MEVQTRLLLKLSFVLKAARYSMRSGQPPRFAVMWILNGNEVKLAICKDRRVRNAITAPGCLEASAYPN
jgi:hypothetical protein